MTSTGAWWESVNVEALGPEARRLILESVKGKLGFTGACEALGIAKSSMHRYLSGERLVPGDVVRRALRLLDEREFRGLLGGWDRLRALGVVRDGGVVDYSLVLNILALASRDEYLRNAILGFVVKEFRDELRRMLGVSYAGIVLRWDEGFELFLRERKRRRRVRSAETLSYYKRLFTKHLEGRELTETLIDEVVNHPNKWLRNVFRHYIQYLYHRRVIGPETFGWIMEVVPSRGYRLDVRPYPVSVDDVRRTMGFLAGRHRLYYTVYRVMLESGARFTHTLKMLSQWSPGEYVEVPGLGEPTPRLVCHSGGGFCRYYLGLRESSKQCNWVYFSTDTLNLILEHAPASVGGGGQVERYAIRHGLVRPKYMRKVAWRLMVKTVGREVARFIQSRFGELSVSEARYEDLLGEADEAYPRYLETLKTQIYQGIPSHT